MGSTCDDDISDKGARKNVLAAVAAAAMAATEKIMNPLKACSLTSLSLLTRSDHP